MKYIQKAPQLVLFALIILISVGGCKSRKKAMEMTKAAEKAKMEQEAAARKQQEEDQKKKDEQARRDEEARKKQQQDQAKASTPYTKLGEYFSAISSSASPASANSSITEALSMFASPETPVLIVISGSGDQKDYDKPTTIRAYLNYLKDQKKNINKIENLQFDDAGKITEVELRK